MLKTVVISQLSSPHHCPPHARNGECQQMGILRNEQSRRYERDGGTDRGDGGEAELSAGQGQGAGAVTGRAAGRLSQLPAVGEATGQGGPAGLGQESCRQGGPSTWLGHRGVSPGGVGVWLCSTGSGATA